MKRKKRKKISKNKKIITKAVMMRRPQLKKTVITKEIFRKIYRCAKQISPTIAMLLDWSYRTGLRTGELLSLNWNDIDFQNQRIILPWSERTIQVPKRLFAEILKVNKKTGPVFLNHKGERCTPIDLAQFLHKLAEKTKINVHLHDFRRSYITNEIEKNNGITTSAQIKRYLKK